MHACVHMCKYTYVYIHIVKMFFLSFCFFSVVEVLGIEPLNVSGKEANKELHPQAILKSPFHFVL